MVILIDTNVALDFLAMRHPYYEDAKNVIRMCAEEREILEMIELNV